ncbi:MAG: hypothetical protein ACXAC5_21435 [Promethearchaeota archaeon]|jgi:hypothetical protein
MSNDSKKKFADYIKVATTTSAGTSVATAAALLGADLVVVALAWDNPPTEGGIVTVTFLMLISFVAFINVLHYIMRFEFLLSRVKINEIDEKVHEKDSLELTHIMRSVRFMHVTGLLFSMIAFWIISYKYLISMDDVGYNFVILILPFILFLLYWVPKIVGVEREVSFRARESLAQLFIQIIFLILICLDFFRVLTIP